jgi:Matrixin.
MKNRSTPGLSRYLCLKRIVAAAVSFVVLAAAFCFQTGATGGNGYPGDSNFTFTAGADNGTFIGWITDITPMKITGNARKKPGSGCQIKIDVYHAGTMQFISSCTVNTDANFDFQWVWGAGDSCFGSRLHVLIYAVSGNSNLMICSTLIDQRSFTHGKLQSGINGQRSFYINTNSSSPTVVSSNERIQIRQAINEWSNTSGILNTPLNFAEITTGSDAKVLFYSDDGIILAPGEAARTTTTNLLGFYFYATIRYNKPMFEDPTNQHYINLNRAKSNGYDSVYYYKLSIFSHEFGHALGLDESNWKAGTSDVGIPDRIMTQTVAKRNGVKRASWLDLKSINMLYR